MRLAPGFPVGTNLRLARKLGEGSMGSVWAAEHLTLHTEVAVKFISRDLASEERVRARFTREATAAAAIKSPHVVQVFDHGFTSDKMPFIVMELLEGEDLGHRLARVGRLPFGDVVQIVEQVCKALSKAHQLGIVHRDIKPENIFLTDSDGDIHVKVLDFGIAKHQRGERLFSLTASGAFMGTPYYMSPEHVMNAKGVDARSDLWSLGIVAYRALTGVIPFDKEDLGQLVMAIDRAVYTPASQLVPELPPGVDGWFERVLAREPDTRFGSAREMADGLRAVLRGSAEHELLRASPAAVESSSSAPVIAAAPFELSAVNAVRVAGADAATPIHHSSATFSVTARETPTRKMSASTRRSGLRAGVVAIIAVAGLGAGGLLAFWLVRPRLGAADAAAAGHPAPSAPATSTPDVQPVEAAPEPSVAAAVIPEAPNMTASAPASAAPPRAAATSTRVGAASADTKSKPAHAATPSCDPPYTFDAEGNRHFRPECFPR